MRQPAPSVQPCSPAQGQPKAPGGARTQGARPARRGIAADRLATLWAARALAAIALIVAGGVHLEQYTVAHFSLIPTIGPLFLVNFIAATSAGVILLVPIGRGAGRVRLRVESLAAVAGLGVSVGAFAALLISEQTPLFGFMEHGYRVEIVIALISEAVAVAALAAVLLCLRSWARRQRPPRHAPRPRTAAAALDSPGVAARLFHHRPTNPKEYPMNRLRLSILAVLTAAVLVVVVATSGGAAKTSHRSAAATSAITIRQTALGKTLVDANGRSLYLFAGDKPNLSTLSAAGQAVWPLYTSTGRPAGSGGALASQIATTSTTGSARQITYHGHPLYYYVGDHKPGDTNGQDLNQFGARWYLLNPSGSAITTTPSTPTPAGSSSGAYGY